MLSNKMSSYFTTLIAESAVTGCYKLIIHDVINYIFTAYSW